MATRAEVRWLVWTRWWLQPTVCIINHQKDIIRPSLTPQTSSSKQVSRFTTSQNIPTFTQMKQSKITEQNYSIILVFRLPFAVIFVAISNSKSLKLSFKYEAHFYGFYGAGVEMVELSIVLMAWANVSCNISQLYRLNESFQSSKANRYISRSIQSGREKKGFQFVF